MKRLAVVLAVCAILGAMAVPAYAATAQAPLELDVPGLIAIPRELDGSLVTFTGEAIGEDLRADDTHRWVNVLQNGTAVGVYVTNEQAAQIEIYGDHGHKGAAVEVVGIVNIADDEHAGEFDVHAQTFTVIEPGSETDRPISPWKAVVAGIALVAALVEVRVYRHMLERQNA